MTTPENRRAHPRVELCATVEVVAGDGEVLILTATNLSMGGAFLEVDLKEYPMLTRGVMLELTISLAETDDAEGFEAEGAAAPPSPLVVRCQGKIVRTQAAAPGVQSGVGVVLVGLPAADVHKLHALLEQAQS